MVGVCQDEAMRVSGGGYGWKVILFYEVLDVMRGIPEKSRILVDVDLSVDQCYCGWYLGFC